MSADNRKKNQPDSDGIVDLLNAFGGYVEKDETSDEINLPEYTEERAEAPAEEESVSHPEPEHYAIGEKYEVTEAYEEIISGMNVVPESEEIDPWEQETPVSAEDIPEPEPKKKKNKKDRKNKKKNEKIDGEFSEEIKPKETIEPAEPEIPAVPIVEDTVETPKKKEEDKKSGKKAGKDKPEKENTKRSSKINKEKPAKQYKKEKETKHRDTEKPGSDKAKVATPARLVVVLTAICAAVALLLGVVNHYTEAKIAENTKQAMLLSIQEIFDETVQAEQIVLPADSELTTAYLVIKNGGVCGYSASVAPVGFGGPINLMVGIDFAGAVVGVDVVSMSETPGLGSKVGSDDFLSLFKGASGEATVDAISGATISSKAMMAGVNSVTANLLDLAALAAERGMSVIPFVPGETVSETTPPATNAPETESTEAVVPEPPATTVPPETEGLPVAPEVSKGDSPPEIIVENPGNEYPGIYAEYEQDTTEFETLTTEPESSELESTDETGEESADNE